MQRASISKNKSRVLSKAEPSIAYANSAGGRVVGYRQLGHGPGVLLVHGGMSSGDTHMQMADAMADEFTVNLVDDEAEV
jgi:hypothetical protein